MLLYILIFFVAINFFIAYKKRKSKFVQIFTVFFMTMVFVGSRGVADLHNYTYDFAHGFDDIWKGGQFLFRFFTIACFKTGMSFDFYRFLISIIGLGFYCKFINKFSPLPNLVIAAYLCYLFIMDDVQIRNFIGCAVFCIGLIPLFNQSEKWRSSFVITTAIAATIHSSFWVYLIFLLIPDDIRKERKIELIGISAVVFSIVVLFTRDYLNSVVLFFAFIDESKTEHYLQETTNFGGALFLIIQVFAIVSIYLLRRRLFKKVDKDLQLDSTYRFLQLSLLIDVLALSLVPAAIFSITFYRLVRNLYFVNTIAFSIGYYKLKSYKWIALMMIAVYTGLYYYYDLTGEFYIEEILVPFFNNNIFF